MSSTPVARIFGMFIALKAYNRPTASVRLTIKGHVCHVDLLHNIVKTHNLKNQMGNFVCIAMPATHNVTTIKHHFIA